MKKSNKAIKVDPETVEELGRVVDETVRREKGLNQMIGEIREKATTAYRVDIERIFDTKEELGNILLLEYVRALNTAKVKEEKEPDPKKIKEEPAPNNKKIKEERKDPVPIERLAKQELPELIHTKKGTAFRHPKPNEILFSADGTPITLEPPRNSIRNMAAAARKPVLVLDQPVAEDMAEVD